VPQGRAAGSLVATNQALPRGAEKIEGFLAKERKNVSPSAERCTSAWDLCVVQDSIPAELGNVWRMLVDVSCFWTTSYDWTLVANVSFVCVSCEQALFIRTVRTGFPLTTSHELPILGMHGSESCLPPGTNEKRESEREFEVVASGEPVETITKSATREFTGTLAEDTA